MENFLKTFPHQLNLICSDEINTFKYVFLFQSARKKNLMVYMNTLLVTHDSTCNYYTTANGYCQLARFSYSSSNFRGSSNDATVFQLKKSINLYDLMSSASGSNGDCYNHGKHQLTYSGQSVRIYY